MQEKAKCGQCFHGGKMGEEAMKDKKKRWNEEQPRDQTVESKKSLRKAQKHYEGVGEAEKAI